MARAMAKLLSGESFVRSVLLRILLSRDLLLVSSFKGLEGSGIGAALF